jgi:hypothetical protein
MLKHSGTYGICIAMCVTTLDFPVLLSKIPDIIRQIKANEVGGACSTHWEKIEKCTRF